MDNTDDTIRRFFALDAAGDLDGLIALFADDATVVDEAQTHRGTDSIRAWRADVASKFTYTTEILAITNGGPGRFLVEGRITGDFPGGVADLKWDFALADGRIRRLMIAP
ncbi:nuclear transport factor 2 family protein [Solirubrobacter sp. CPCC 204708]|uniref:Nuclear transport factor 2 family protein n=1 Tax=Solirubrobacter deserti TaxID=2282478 RepID=A0ABT4RQG9_9ACTN|nr:nuclear transport factor 2 family protein [Solirubrobacter deserti]MBE2320614.1 nuclear transport factor 2 family protein [Solirubrobacter deserti]MDA0140668.1 nuclear transport factor 2 family protein [Solirubrobacter deserti]